MTDFSNEYISSKIKANNLEWFFLALDESIIVIDPFWLLFIQGIDAEFEVTEKLPSINGMPWTITGKISFKEVRTVQYNLRWNLLRCVTMDEDKNIREVEKELFEQNYKVFENIWLFIILFTSRNFNDNI